MTDHTHYNAILAEGSAVPNLLCGHCRSILSRARMFRNEGENQQGIQCRVLALCSADDCGAVNCCDDAMAEIENPDRLLDLAC